MLRQGAKVPDSKAPLATFLFFGIVSSYSMQRWPMLSFSGFEKSQEISISHRNEVAYTIGDIRTFFLRASPPASSENLFGIVDWARTSAVAAKWIASHRDKTVKCVLTQATNQRHRDRPTKEILLQRFPHNSNNEAVRTTFFYY